jgi:ribose 5-phosphate isomerase RpiB
MHHCLLCWLAARIGCHLSANSVPGVGTAKVKPPEAASRAGIVAGAKLGGLQLGLGRAPSCLTR